ncbi:hypothetical protein G7Z17_g1120 [Cylindrodendrum hubeiense]|uniref:tRNA pseudouridine synthase 1 n=1 Tax=Cylindrodendrum hubeiense TaxID=595255 RepID=A0A9P5LKC8_9HYPO|nr:hypothetical protein G7Z17_g1120 [Cylindrodendrum hubeiense]
MRRTLDAQAEHPEANMPMQEVGRRHELGSEISPPLSPRTQPPDYFDEGAPPLYQEASSKALRIKINKTVVVRILASLFITIIVAVIVAAVIGKMRAGKSPARLVEAQETPGDVTRTGTWTTLTIITTLTITNDGKGHQLEVKTTSAPRPLAIPTHAHVVFDCLSFARTTPTLAARNEHLMLGPVCDALDPEKDEKDNMLGVETYSHQNCLLARASYLSCGWELNYRYAAMAADNEAPVASSASNPRSGEGSGNGNADGGSSSKNESGKDGFRRNPSHDHRTRGKGRSEKGRGEWGRQKQDKRKKNDDYHEYKRRKLNPNGDAAQSEANNPFSKDEISAEERRPKRKVAVLVGYAGTGYKGMQVNGDEKTIEADLFKAFVAAGAISKANADDPKKSSLVRCARTDKGVHAAGNVISLKLIIEDEDVIQKINDALPDQIRVWDIQRTNNSFSCYQLCDSRWYEYLMPSYCLLPPHPETFLGRKLVELAKEHGVEDDLNAKMADVKDFWTDVEEKEIKPILAALDPEIRAAVLERLHVAEESAEPAEEKEVEEKEEKPATETVPEGASEAPQASVILESHQPKGRELGPVDFALRDIKAAYVSAKRRYRVTPDRLQRLQDTLDVYNGTRNFHNYTVQKSFFDASAKRHIKSFIANPKPIIINDTEWLSLKVHGQSFMMHQIRKMVGLASLMVRCGTPIERVEESYLNQKMAIPKAPGLGLLLERPVFHNYNRKATENYNKDTIDFAKYDEKIQAFKDKQIYQRIFNVEEKDNSFHMFFNQIDQFKTNHFLWLTAGGMKAAEIDRGSTGEKVQRDVDKRLGDDDEDEDPEGGEG